MDALYLNVVFASALELDDFHYRGHMGQSVVLTPLALAEFCRCDGAKMLRAQIVANELAGRLGWAITAHTDPDLWQTRAKYLDDLLGLTAEGPFGRLAYAEALSRAGTDIDAALGLWATWWRDVLLVQRALSDDILNLDRKAQLLQQADLFRGEQVEGALRDLMQTARRIKANVNARLALDVLLLRLPKPAVA